MSTPSTSAWDRAFGLDGDSPPPLPQPDPHAVRRRRRRRPRTAQVKRADIQGLRAVAVVTVVINHLTGYPRGGFVGVDVFFVISGYLITSHLVRDLGRTPGGRPQTLVSYLGGFYRRRIRRLFPAALLVLLLTVLASWAVFTHDRFVSTVHDCLYAAVFWANWHFFAQGTNYFTAGLPDSPVQHYWSLSVEEQFYVVWPVVLFVLGAALMARHPDHIRRRRLAGATAAGLLVVGSLAYAFWESNAEPVSAYFSTWARGWELGLGGLIACVVPYLKARSSALTAMSWLGLAMIVVSLFTVRGGHGFPAPGAILPCAGSALVIAAISGGREAWNPVLTNRASVFLGDISYSLYLVHFPVIILMSTWMNQKGSYFYAAAALTALGISIGLYALVERPVLNSPWLLPRSRRDDRELKDTPATSRLALMAATVTVVGWVAVALWPGVISAQVQAEQQIKAAIDHPAHHGRGPAGHRGNPARRRRMPKPRKRGGSTAPVATVAPAEPITASGPTPQLRAALLATHWPALTPSITSVVNGPFVPDDIKACDTLTSLPTSCTFGPANASHTVELVGDSQAVAWAQAFRAVLSHHNGWALHLVGAHNCSFADTEILSPSASIAAQCLTHNKAVVADIKAHRPDVLVVANLANGASDAPSVANEIKSVQHDVKSIVIVGSPPAGADPRACYTSNSVPADCVTKVAGYYEVWSQQMAQVAASVGGHWIDVLGLYCYNGYCPEFAGSTPMRYDADHMSYEYADKIAPDLAAALSGAGLFSG